MKVNTGSARGRNIETLPGDDIVRPTTQKAKEGIFSALQFYVPGARVLDLFAGSGQLGIEALSRGASHCVFVDNSRAAIAVIKRNLNRTELFQSAAVAEMDAVRYVQRANGPFDIIFADPPYRKDIMASILPHLSKNLAPGGFAALETERSLAMPQEYEDLVLRKRYDYGNVTIWLYRKPEAEGEGEA